MIFYSEKMNNLKPNWILFKIAIYVAIAVFVVLFIGKFRGWQKNYQTEKIARIATQEAEWLLTEVHGEEVFSVIENLESKRNSLETNKDKTLLSELIVSPYLDRFLQPRPENEVICDYSECLITSSVGLESVRVLEYSPEYFTAMACGTRYGEYVTPQGYFIRDVNLRYFNVLYVFVYNENTWKLEGAFDVTIPKDAYRDWDYIPEWLQEIIGPLPLNLSCEAKPIE